MSFSPERQRTAVTPPADMNSYQAQLQDASRLRDNDIGCEVIAVSAALFVTKPVTEHHSVGLLALTDSTLD